MRRFYLIIFVFLLLLLNNSRVYGDDRLIVPGKRVGGIKIGDAYHLYEKVWGKPDKVDKIPEGIILTFTRLKMGFLENKDLILVIYCGNPYYRTKDGLKVGDKQYRIKREFSSDAKTERLKTGGLVIHYPEEKISFKVSPKGIIEQIIVY